MSEDQRIVELRERLAESIRICVREELLENFGHVSARDPESQRIFVLRHLHVIAERDGVGSATGQHQHTGHRR